MLPELPHSALRTIQQDVRTYLSNDEYEVGYPNPPYHDTSFDFATWDETLMLVEKELDSRTTRDQDDTERK